MAEVTAPAVDPLQRTDVDAPDSYRHGEPVWVWAHGQWWPGEGEAGGRYGVCVRYEVGGGGRVDTVRPEYVLRRDGS